MHYCGGIGSEPIEPVIDLRLWFRSRRGSPPPARAIHEVPRCGSGMIGAKDPRGVKLANELMEGRSDHALD